MSIQRVKEEVISKLFDRGIYTRQVNEIQYVTRCPYCGDSRSRRDTGHLYLRINPKDQYNMVYNCFKCPAQGVVTSETLELLDLDIDNNLKLSMDEMNKTAKKFDNKNVDPTVMVDISYDFELPEITLCNKTKYINDRLGIKLSLEELRRMRVITSFRDFVRLNKIKDLSCKPGFARMLDSDYIGFLTSKKSHILFRDTTDSHDIRWYKYKIVADSTQNSMFFYTIESSVDILTTDTITINLAEGVLDIASAVFNLGYDKENSINIAMTGKYHNTILRYLVKLGFVGSNIVVNIFSDADHRYNDKAYDTTLPFYRKVLSKYKYVFGQINIIYNMVDKDIGVPKEKIYLEINKL